MPDLTAGDLSIHYVDTPPLPGRPTIVLLHGAGANHTIWLAVMKALRGRARVLVPDLPGHGRSDSIPGLTVDEYAAAITPFLESFHALGPGGSPFVLAGHSMGGAIALTLSIRRPDLMDVLILAGAAARFEVSGKLLSGLRETPAETLAVFARWQFLEQTDPAIILRSMSQLAGTPAGRVLSDLEACRRWDPGASLERVAHPALVLCGREDLMTPPRACALLAARLPRATLRLLDGAAHALMIERPDEVAEEILGFLSSL